MKRCFSQIDLISDDDHDRQVASIMASQLQVGLHVHNDLSSYATDPSVEPWIVCRLKLRDGTGADLMRKLRSASMDVPVTFLRENEPVSEMLAVMRFGYRDVLQKPIRVTDLEAILNERFDDIEVKCELAKATLHAHQKLACLDKKENEVLEAAADGLPNKIAALKLGVSLRTLERRRYLLMKKLGVESGEELVVLAVRKQYASWFDPEFSAPVSTVSETTCHLKMA